MISVKNLSIRFGSGANEVVAVDDISFEVERHQMFGLVGESGSGKSTILRAITGLNSNWQGEILIDGKPVEKRPDKNYYKQVQMVFQDPYSSLHPRHSIYRILAEPLQIHKLDNHSQRIESVLQQVQLEKKFQYRYPHQLSGGQRQRVAIARALLLEPKVLLLDEPTSALDVSIQAEILNLLMDLQGKLDLTCIFVSHDLSVIAHMCDIVAVMKRGKIVEHLSVEDLDNNNAKQEYTKTLITASKGYVKGSRY